MRSTSHFGVLGEFQEKQNLDRKPHFSFNNIDTHIDRWVRISLWYSIQAFRTQHDNLSCVNQDQTIRLNITCNPNNREDIIHGSK